MATVQNTGNPRSIIILHYVMIVLTLAAVVIVLERAIFAPDVPTRITAFIFGMGFLFGAYKLWEYRARR